MPSIRITILTATVTTDEKTATGQADSDGMITAFSHFSRWTIFDRFPYLGVILGRE